ncbi:hypothetical protein D2V93_08455 [Flagellimonas taeanensis]|uniref:hypothetical protein n=1 Tax=Flagellimonas taeanensis TaxID=1005926 RepID=UPI000E697B9B|nr:hypothetical protein [Allomuricauda taeanensis]RIV50892.1 hypothetical protein D2V93_08455 [Allomuricauda taeanensis]
METVVITKELFDELVLDKARELRQKRKTHCIDKWEAMKILGCKERRFYDLLKAPNTLIRRGSVKGSFVEESIYKERDRHN